MAKFHGTPCTLLPSLFCLRLVLVSNSNIMNIEPLWNKQIKLRTHSNPRFIHQNQILNPFESLQKGQTLKFGLITKLQIRTNQSLFALEFIIIYFKSVNWVLPSTTCDDSKATIRDPSIEIHNSNTCTSRFTM